MIHNDIVRGLGGCILTLILGGCITIKPTIKGSHFWACTKLCHGNLGVAQMSSVMKLNYAGNLTVLSEECACKNKRSFSIMESKQD